MNIQNEIRKINHDSIYDFKLKLDDNDISSILANEDRIYEMNNNLNINDLDYYYDSFFNKKS